MKYVLTIMYLVLVLGCSSNEVRTKWTDKDMRVMIDPDTIDVNQYVRLQTSLVNTEMWTVIDRKQGYEAIKKEQEREHRHEHDRFEDKEKWAWWGKIYGVGAIIVPYADCYLRKNIFTESFSKVCNQFLYLVDSNTAEVIIATENRNSSSESNTPDWEDIVELMVDKYPKRFSEIKYSERLKRYQKESEDRAKIEREKNERVINKITN